MNLFCKAIGLWVLLCATGPLQALSPKEVEQELDAYWTELARTVEEGDFSAYAAAYHPDAVLVSISEGKSYPIAQALDRWEQGFIDAREGRTRATVSFRFSQRLHDASSAHETGIFRYAAESDTGEPAIQYIHFEALLVKRQGWLTVMEYQKTTASEADWNALK